MKTFKLTTASVLLLGTTLGIGSLTVQADEITQVHDTQAFVTFKASTEPVNPVNPLDPDEDVTPVNPDDSPTDGGTNGPLSLDYASNLDFGENVISTQDKTYQAKAQKLSDGSYVPNYAQVTDNRGTLKGWKLSIKQNAQLKTAESESLTGAAISFNNAELASISASTAPGTVTSSFTLTPGVEETLLVAGEGEGAGTWVYRFGTDANIDSSKKTTDSVTLSVPGSTEKLAKSYSASLTWTLKNVPENEETGA
ncbi:WxL domain-containing protein [Listeria ilorinensis]|uniref:WxL domain-containing protein n=1 Tax=Listeria ilorinensis TaxID=2867439 RepID=UPI001EF41B21|nr:WxL domain-containing protein [Listeria ilorinensis]